MIKMQNLKVLLFVCACMLPVVASCKATPFHVDLASGYAGSVTISCDSTGTAFDSVRAGANGHAEAKVCPVHPVDIVVIRDGAKVSMDGAPAWETTGDGIPVGIRFAVK